MARKSQKEWEGLVREFEASGLTQTRFATRHGLNVGTFQSWLYKTRRRNEPKKSPTFIEITGSDSAVTVTFRGIEIVFAEPPSVAWLAELAASQ